MDAKTARQILDAGTDWDKNQWEAQGYLAALEGPEVKALVDAVEHFSSCSANLAEGDECAGCDKASKALALYKESIKNSGKEVG